MLNTLVHNQPVNKGLHWAMFDATVDAVYVHNRTGCVHSGRKILLYRPRDKPIDFTALQ